MPDRRFAVAGLVLAAVAALLPHDVHAQAAPSERQLLTCAGCHGPGGRSVHPEFPSLAGQPRLFIETQLVLIREGLRPVPAMQGLLNGMTDPEIIALAQYFNAQAPAESPRATDTAAYDRGRGLAARLHCASCHVGNYAGQQQVPRLAGQPEAFLRNSMKQLRDNPGPGRDTIMASVLYGLKDGDLNDLAHFLAHFRP